MPTENRAEPLGFGGQYAPPSVSPEIAKKLELESLRVEVIETERKLVFLRERIRSLGGLDPASEAGLP